MKPRVVPRLPRRVRARAVTTPIKRLTLKVLREGAAEVDELDALDPADAQRPRTRSECGTERPCPWVACKHHLFLDVDPETGSIKLNFPELQPEDMRESCTLDVAEQGALSLEAVAEKLNLTRERIRQLEIRGLLKLRRVCRREA